MMQEAGALHVRSMVDDVATAVPGEPDGVQTR